MKGPKPRDLRERFESKMLKTEACWLWQGPINRKGYGTFQIKTPLGNWQPEYAHRVAYGLYKGPIPFGLSIDHLCSNRSCVNPEHLEAVTQQVNLLRGKTLQARNLAKTHCPKGHPYDEANT